MARRVIVIPRHRLRTPRLGLQLLLEWRAAHVLIKPCQRLVQKLDLLRVKHSVIPQPARSHEETRRQIGVLRTGGIDESDVHGCAKPFLLSSIINKKKPRRSFDQRSFMNNPATTYFPAGMQYHRRRKIGR